MLPKNADKNLFFCYSRIYIIVFQSFFSTTTFIVVCKAVLPHRDSHCSSSLTGRGQCRMTRLLQLGSPLRPIVRLSSAIGSDVTFGVPHRGLKVIRLYRYYVKLCGHVSIFVIS